MSAGEEDLASVFSCALTAMIECLLILELSDWEVEQMEWVELSRINLVDYKLKIDYKLYGLIYGVEMELMELY